MNWSQGDPSSSQCQLFFLRSLLKDLLSIETWIESTRVSRVELGSKTEEFEPWRKKNLKQNLNLNLHQDWQPTEIGAYIDRRRERKKSISKKIKYSWKKKCETSSLCLQQCCRDKWPKRPELEWQLLQGNRLPVTYFLNRFGFEAALKVF